MTPTKKEDRKQIQYNWVVETVETMETNYQPSSDLDISPERAVKRSKIQKSSTKPVGHVFESVPDNVQVASQRVKCTIATKQIAIKAEDSGLVIISDSEDDVPVEKAIEKFDFNAIPEHVGFVQAQATTVKTEQAPHSQISSTEPVEGRYSFRPRKNTPIPTFPDGVFEDELFDDSPSYGNRSKAPATDDSNDEYQDDILNDDPEAWSDDDDFFEDGHAYTTLANLVDAGSPPALPSTSSGTPTNLQSLGTAKYSSSRFTAATFDVDFFDDGLRGKKITSIICISRNSGGKSQENRKNQHNLLKILYDTFLAQVHQKWHGCDSCDCPKEFKSFVFNKISSNNDMSKCMKEDHRNLRHYLNTLANKATPNSATVVIFCGEDGLSTYAPGVRDFFEPYIKANIVLYMWKRDLICRTFFVPFPLAELIEAVSDAEQKVLTGTISLDLVQTWNEIALRKETVAAACRSNRQLTGRHDRNNITPANPLLAAPNTTILEMTPEAILSRKTSLVYPLEYVGSQVKCVLADCDQTFENSKLLRLHLIEKCKAQGFCLLCPPGENSLFKKSSVKEDFDFRKYLYGHMACHLPPEKFCPRTGCDFVTSRVSHLNRHIRLEHERSVQEKHNLQFECEYPNCERRYPTQKSLLDHRRKVHGNDGSPQKFECEHCGAKFVTPYNLQEHQAERCPVLRETQRVVFPCPVTDCNAIFASSSAVQEHIRTHERRDKLLNYVQAVALDTD